METIIETQALTKSYRWKEAVHQLWKSPARTKTCRPYEIPEILLEAQR